jgi:hypothetical protein
MTDLVSARVVRGTILQPGRDQNGVEHWSAPWIEYGPGSTVMLPPDEFNRLHLSGALASPPIGHRGRNAPAK